jgi:hypothetical protein
MHVKPYRVALALGLAVLLGWAEVGDAGGRGGGRGRGHSFHGGRGGGSHGAFHGHGVGRFQGGHRHHGHGFGHRGFHGRAFIGAGPLFFWGPSFVYAPPAVLAAPPVWVEQGSYGYWYYCPSARAYYPYVAACPEPWVPVPAR